MNRAVCIHELTKVFIFRDQDAIFAGGKLDHIRIFQSLSNLTHCEHIVPVFS